MIMKAIKFFTVPTLIIGMLILIIPFQSCEPIDNDPDDCDTCRADVYKPNIYIYPTEAIDLNVHINFPQGGEILSSIPEYGTGWNIFVEPNGLINNTYHFLFYESSQPNVWQHDLGWIIEKTGLADFFTKNLTDYGFNGQEIEDFIDYWIPRLTDYNFYAIYPQNADIIDEVIELYFSEKPNNLMRLFYLIEGLNETPELKPEEPDMSLTFERKDFFVVEWGVILK